MGCIASAELFWGFASETEDAWETDEVDEDGDRVLLEISRDVDMDHVYAATKGVIEPAEEFSDATKPLYMAYWGLVRPITEACPCDVAYYGYDYQKPYVCIKESRKVVDWCEVGEVKSLEVCPTWFTKLHDYCKAMKIPFQEPKWCLVASYG